MIRVSCRQFPLWLALVLAAAPSHAQTVRQHPPHVHGRGALNIVLDGHDLAAELTAPADDIVGFEHPPHGDADTKAVHAAVTALSDAARILGLPPAAACAVDDTDIDSPLIPGGHDDGAAAGHHAGSAHAHETTEEHEHEHGDGDEHEHAEFHVTYRLTCAAPEKLDHLTVGYFEAFARAQSLVVQAVGPTGQTSATLTRTEPRLSL